MFSLFIDEGEEKAVEGSEKKKKKEKRKTEEKDVEDQEEEKSKKSKVVEEETTTDNDNVGLMSNNLEAQEKQLGLRLVSSVMGQDEPRSLLL